MLEQLGGQRVVGAQFLQHVLVGRRHAARRLLLDRQAELAEQHLADLLRTAQVERLAGERVALALQRQHALGELPALRRQQGRIDQHAVLLDAAEDPAGRHLDAPVHVGETGGRFDLRQQSLVHVQRHVAVFARVLAGPADLHLRERDLLGALAAHVLVAQAGSAQMAKRHAFQAVRPVRLQHIAFEHGVVGIAAHGHASAGEHVRVVLDVLADLGGASVLEPRLQLRQHVAERQLLGCAGVAVVNRDVGRLARRHRQRDADDAGTDGVERVGLGVDRHELRGGDAPDPGVEPVGRGDRLVVLDDGLAAARPPARRSSRPQRRRPRRPRWPHRPMLRARASSPRSRSARRSRARPACRSARTRATRTRASRAHGR